MKEKCKKYVGIDIGGTTIKGGIIDSFGKIVISKEIPTQSDNGVAFVVSNIIELINNLLKESKLKLADVEGIGIGSPANIDSKNGIVRTASNLGWKNVPLVKELKKIFKTKIKLTNDANAAALGEASFGAGKEFKNLVMITLGTGVGSGIILNKKIFSGTYSSGAEIGHIIIENNGRQCTCGQKGCIEAYCSAPALLKRTKSFLTKNHQSILNQIKNISVKDIFENYHNDELAKKMIDEYIDFLSIGIINIANLLQPEAIIIGGGVSKAGNLLVDKLMAKTQDKIFARGTIPPLKIVIASLSNNAGFIGAALQNK